MAGNDSPLCGDAQPPSDQQLEANAALDEQWRAAEDDDWPSQLESSTIPGGPDFDSHSLDAGNIGYQDKGPRHPAAQEDISDGRATYNSTSPKATDHSSQATPPKVTLFTRPSSSHEDPAAGFSFSKAKPTQPLDFSRNKKTNNIVSAVPQAPSPSTKSASQSKNAVAGSSEHDHASVQTSASSKQDKAPLRLLKVPFPNVALKVTETHRLPLDNPIGEQHCQEFLSRTTTLQKLSMSGHETPAGSEMNERCNDQIHGEALKSLEGPVNEPLLPGHVPGCVPVKVINHTHHESSINPELAFSVFEPNDAQAQAKDKKTRKARTRTLVSSGEGQAHACDQNLALSDDDLLRALSDRYEKSNHERAALQQSLQLRESEYRELYAASEELFEQLESTSKRYRESEAQLAKLKEAKPRYETTIRKLGDYVKGLTNDHNRLRDDAKYIRELQTSVIEDKEAIFRALRDAYEATDNNHTRVKHHLTKAHRNLQILGQTVKDQEVQLKHEETLLASERQRNDRLEEQISTFTTSHTQLSGTFRDYRETTTGKLNELIGKAMGVQNQDPLVSQDHLMPMLEQCISLLQGLTGSDNAKGIDLQELNDTMRGYFESIACSVKSCEHSTSILKEDQHQLALSMENQLRDLNSNVTAERSLSKQIMDLREIKATIKERLQGTETVLKDAQLEVSKLQDKLAEQSRFIANLEKEAQNRSRVEKLETAARLQELTTRNRELQKDLTDQITEKSSLDERLRTRDEEFKLQQDRLADVQLRVEEANQQTATALEEKSHYVKQMESEREEIRNHLSRTANQELDDLKSKHLNEIQQLKLAKPSAEDQYREASLKLIRTRHDKERWEKEVSDTRASMEIVQKEREIEIAIATNLRRAVADLEAQLEKKDTSFRAIQQELQDTILDNEAKDRYIKSYHDASAKERSRRSPSNRRVVGAQAIRDVSPMVVEDSQPTGQPAVASLADIMSDQAQQSLLGPEEDYSGLFPTTPMGQAKSQGLEISHVKYSRSKVTSRETINTSEAYEKNPEPLRRMASRPGPQANRSLHSRNDQDLSSQKSQHGVAVHQPQPSQSPVNNRDARQSSRGMSVVPRGILKTSVQERKGEKRTASALGSHHTTELHAKRRKSSSQANMIKDLGPIVQDSQSPVRPISSRARKQAPSRKHGKADKFTRSFDEHLN